METKYLDEIVRKVLWRRVVNKRNCFYDEDNKLTRLCNSFVVIYGHDEWTNAVKRYESLKRSRMLVKKHISKMLTHFSKVYFVTMTFDDEILSKTSLTTRHRYVKELLSNNCADYLANVDYGAKKGREHYHAVIAFYGSPEQFKKLYSYGFCDIKLCGSNDSDKTRLTRYILKLTNHATKDTAGKPFHKRNSKKDRESGNFEEINIDELPF